MIRLSDDRATDSCWEGSRRTGDAWPAATATVRKEGKLRCEIGVTADAGAAGLNWMVMNYYGSKELAAAFRTVRENTMRIAEEIPEESYGFRATPEVMSVGETLVHLALSPRFPEEVHFVRRLNTLAGFDFFGFRDAQDAEAKAARDKAAIIELLRTEGERFAGLLENAPDEFLGERVDSPAGMTPAFKTRFEMLLGAKEHEMHHRGQLMLVERMLGITPHLTRRRDEMIAAMKARAAG